MPDEQPQVGTTETKPTAPQASAVAATEPPSAQAAPAQTTQPPAAESKVETLPEWAQKELSELRKENAKRRKDAQAAEQKAAQDAEAKAKEQGEFKKLFEARDKELANMKAELARRERADLQRRIAEEVGIPAKLAAKISGDDEEAMRKDATEMLSALPKSVANNDAKNGTGPGAKAPRSYGGMSKEQAAAFLGVNPKDIPD